LGRHVGLGGFEKRVVIKRILPNLASQPAFVDMFLHEARVAARINHSNVVQIFDFGRMGEDYYIVMEYVRGWDLSSLIRSSVRLGRPIPIEVACRIAAEVCAGLTAAHNALDDTGTPNPIIHRDISPHNILLSLDGAVKLSDFGIAKTARDIEKMAVTDPGSVKGKVAYLAPEVIQGTAPTTKIDIYAVGLTLYTALVGRNPYQRKGDIQTMYAVAQEPLPNIIKERRDVPFQLASIVGRAVHRDAGQRFPTAQMLQLHLESFLTEIERQQPSTPMHIALWITELARDAQEHHGGLQMDSDSTPSGTPEVVGTLATPGFASAEDAPAELTAQVEALGSSALARGAAADLSQDDTQIRIPEKR
jgi:eukaryotic-like serine/threonine-protein kinase